MSQGTDTAALFPEEPGNLRRVSGKGPRVEITGALAALMDRERRERLKMTWQALHERSEVDVKTLQRVLGAHRAGTVDGGAGFNDPRRASAANVAAIMTALGITSDTMLDDGTLARQNISTVSKRAGKVVMETGPGGLSPDEADVLELYRRIKKALPERAESYRRELEKFTESTEYVARVAPAISDEDRPTAPSVPADDEAFVHGLATKQQVTVKR